MMTRTLCLAVALFVGACSQPAPQAKAPATATSVKPADEALVALTSEGYGPLKIGMTRAEVENALGGPADPNASGGPDPNACDEFHPAHAPVGLYVMIEEGKLARVTAAGDDQGAPSHVKTDKGVGLGASVAEVIAAYPGIKSEPHKYIGPPGAYLTMWSKGDAKADYVQDPAARGVRFEIGEDGKVAMIHTGGPSIQYVEGCA